jgi:hypothetical protein
MRRRTEQGPNPAERDNDILVIPDLRQIDRHLITSYILACHRTGARRYANGVKRYCISKSSNDLVIAGSPTSAAFYSGRSAQR